MLLLHFLAWFGWEKIVDSVTIDHIYRYFHEKAFLATLIIFASLGTAIAIDLDLGTVLVNVPRNAKLVIGSINWKNRLGVSPKILNQARPIKVVISLLISVLYNSEDILDSPRHNTALFASFAMQRVGLSWLWGSKEDDSAIFAFDEGLNHGFDALAVELVLSLHLAEDIVELEEISVVAIWSTVLPIK